MKAKDRAKLVQQLAEWIDTEVIAETIVDCLADAGVKVNLKNSQEAWLGMCDDLAYQVKIVIAHRM